MRTLISILLLLPSLAFGQASPVRLDGVWVVPVRAADGYSTTQQFRSQLATGTAPFVAASTTASDINVLKLNGQADAYYLNATNLASGTLPAARFPALTGDITTTAGSLATAIGAGKVTNTMLAGSIASVKLVGTDIVTVGTITTGTWTGTAIAVASGGTGGTTAAAARTNLGMGTSDTPQFAKLGLGVSPTGVEIVQVSTADSAGRFAVMDATASTTGRIVFKKSGVLQSILGFGNAGELFSLALAGSTALRAENALMLGVGSSHAMVIREIGYAPGNGYIGVGGHTDPLSVFEISGESDPELGIRSTNVVTGRRYTIQSGSLGTLTIIDRTTNVNRLAISTAGSLQLSTVGEWIKGTNTAGAAQPLIRARGAGYSQVTYPGAQVGQTGDHVALFIDPASVAGGSFGGNTNELLLPNSVQVLQANSGGTDWIYPALVLSDGKLGIGMTPVKTLDVTGTFRVSGIATMGAPITLMGYTVATLPTGVTGHMAYVTNAIAPSYGVTVVGGGAIVTPVFYDGATWKAH